MNDRAPHPDLPPDSERLEVLLFWHQMWVRRIEQALTVARQREAEQERRRQRAVAESRFKVEPGLDEQTLHRGGCTKYTTSSLLTRDEALLAVHDEALAVRACQACRPDTALRE
ncbi:DUF6233 domain-containing protein [Streptomyces sp. NPDC059786]|uniref:DUF6233 domain-containing protein n=1 Tax=Streptomyces sp. NPDC059786 TaxID=3346946 RepID=UPI00366711FE